MITYRAHGLFLFIIGLLLLTMALGGFIFRLVLALIGLWFINLGLQLIGGPHWFYVVTQYRRQWW